jgi:hypothetical protein
MQFSPTAETMHADASFYNERLDALREETIEAQESDEKWLEEYLVDDDVNHWTNWKNPFRRED